MLSQSCSKLTTSDDWEKLVVLLLNDEDIRSQNLMLEGGASVSNDTVVERKFLRELREDDPFHFFSIPGSLRHEFAESEESSRALLANLKSGNVARKTRVSVEVHSDMCMEEMMSKIEAPERNGLNLKKIMDQMEEEIQKSFGKREHSRKKE